MIEVGTGGDEMVEVLDFKALRVDSDDSRELHSLLRQLLGQPFLFFRVSYGDELTLHLGEPRSLAHPRSKRLRKGSYILGARSSRWYLRPGTEPSMFVGVDDESEASTRCERIDIREVESRRLVESGSVVASVDVLPSVGGFGLSLSLSDRSTLVILPAPPPSSVEDEGEAVEGDDIADWEIFTPHDRYLRVGPGPRWSYLESNKPAGD
jgi:hypothetical protein